MLATPIAYGSDYKDLREATWIVEEKFDGIRAQLHKVNGTVRIFLRTLNDITHSYPEIVSAASAIAGNFILGGEIVARRDDQVLPLRYLQARLQRKTIDAQLLDEVPVAFMVFDILAAGDEFLVDEPLIDRRNRLAETLIRSPHRRRTYDRSGSRLRHRSTKRSAQKRIRIAFPSDRSDP